MSLFKKPKGNFRKRRTSYSSDEEDDEHHQESSVLGETRELQKLRKRQRGVNIEDLAAVHVVKKEEKGNADPLKLKTGGFVDLKTLKKEIASAETIDDIEQIGTTFAAETNRRDEDADMVKYVEAELAKRKGILTEQEKKESNQPKNPMDALYELPEHIKQITSSHKKSEDMLSNQMLSGIPEMDLGIDAKIQNIEVTEEAKQKLLDEKKRKKDNVSKFVPTNMAVNFVQHNRFKVEDIHNIQSQKKKEAVAPKPAPLRVGETERPLTLHDAMPKKNPGEKATDDFVYERFKKQLRR